MKTGGWKYALSSFKKRDSIPAVLSFLLCATFVASCGGGGSSTTSDNTLNMLPVALSASLSTDATSASVGTTITANLRDGLDCSSITFVLSVGPYNVPGVTSCSGTTVTFQPAKDLAYNNTYTVIIKANAADAAGSTLRDYSFSFTLVNVPSVWTTSSLLKNTVKVTDDFEASLQLALDVNGIASAVWEQGGSILASLHDPANGWTEKHAVSSGPTDAHAPLVSLDASGNVMAVWIQHGESGMPSMIMAAYYDPGAGWSMPTAVTDHTSDIDTWQVAADGNGDFIVVWSQVNIADYDFVAARRYQTSTRSWDAPLQLSDPLGYVMAPQVVSDGDGNVTVAWAQATSNMSASTIWASRYEVGSQSWQASCSIGDNTLVAFDGETQPHVVVTHSGAVVIIWEHIRGTQSEVWRNQYTSGTGWSIPGPAADNLVSPLFSLPILL